MKHKQQGMTLIGWVATIAIVLVLAFAGIRLVPVYLQYLKIADVIRDAPLRLEKDGNVSPAKIRSYIEKRFDVEAITVIVPEDVAITRKNDNFVVTADYDHQVPYLGNVNFLVEFTTESTVRR